MTDLEFILQQAINAISLGSLYAMVAVGLSMVFGILRMTNFAHGDMMMAGSYATVLLTVAGLPFGVAVVCGVGVSVLVGVLAERIAYRPVRGAPDVTLLLTSLALTYVLENLAILIFSSSPRAMPLPDWMGEVYSFSDGAITFTGIDLCATVLALCSLLGLGWFVTRTTTGLGMRAAAEDMAATALVGLNLNRLIVTAFAIASGFAGLAGVLWAAQSGVVDPGMGFSPLLKAFVAAIVGGFGSIAGAVMGGYLLGALEILIVGFAPPEISSYRDAIVFALLILFLLFRPGGLMRPNREIKL
ncbi:branched-chain amino acid ABC transporter permease [Rhodospirillum rubrum]|uniref:branched-chain amino acid ABC transporter permease n=1 Tax=Rhodospirillum rubrum TaxID=1085 RepID=UPI0019068F24|nr:branched-chain amino acid ABC transporter permease [Rhodospirillum rubrum]MBK1663479.1 branched-chain amino acid ABC transporter permease [Rhodospirillum rubrum]MBK1675677.1 branched-chain amino acid ABC transporter permease [Rhodospirillum rubrum]